jgi:cysteine-rich repeat protein
MATTWLRFAERNGIFWGATLGLLATLPCTMVEAGPSSCDLNEHVSCHYETQQADPNDLAWFIADDRGGVADGYGFAIEYDADDNNSENFCSHCSLALFTADVGLRWADLETLRVSRGEVDSREELTPLIGELAILNAEALVRRAHPDYAFLDENEQMAAMEEVLEIQERLQAAVARIILLTDLRAGIGDPGQRTIRELVRLLGLKLDSGFGREFDHPNDRQRENSGILVYPVAAYIAALLDMFQDDPNLDAIRENILQLNLDPMLEVTGDDNDNGVADPVVYHARNSDMIVKQRTWALPSQRAVLVTYTIVNTTDKILPNVQLAMIADYDIPPGSMDSGSVFFERERVQGNPTDSGWVAVMTYDSLPYEDPEIHYWFASGPVGLRSQSDLQGDNEPCRGPACFDLANVNLDTRLSLSQTARSINDNRFRFFLRDPTVSQTIDRSEGKTEKQGAVAIELLDPMLPGDQKQAGFCFAVGRATSEADARMEVEDMLEECQDLYDDVTGVCGDGDIDFGEACDDGNNVGGDGCSATCEPEVCGDGEQTGAETCDDGNQENNDGCSHPECQLEVCGDGIVQTGEECDDGNRISSDACLNNCEPAHCGDGFLRMCDPQVEDCGGVCAGHTHCLTSSLTFLTQDSNDTGIFDDLIAESLTLTIGFDVETATRDIDDSSQTIVSGPINIDFEGHPFAETVLQPGFHGTQLRIELTATDMRIGVTGLGFRDDDDHINLSIFSGMRFDTDGDGVPTLDSVRFIEAQGAILTRRTPGQRQPTDTSRGEIGGLFELSGGFGSEDCDDGNRNDQDVCTNTCRDAVCGDGVVYLEGGEECDGGDGCDPNCQLIVICGNGNVEDPETCDDGNENDGDGCSAICQNEICGDAVVQPDEGCDDGNNEDNDGCSAACAEEVCGDGILHPGEECDTGDAVADDAECTGSCASARCGDGLVHSGAEECDDGNLENEDGCTDACVTEFCGDGLGGPDEDCDDGNGVDGDGCSTGCLNEYCGDALPGPGEQCDDANQVDGDGCDKDCQLENLDACGDGNVGVGEQCDDANRDDDDGCDSFCQLENVAACGDGNLDTAEQCDDGNNDPGDGCSRFCTEERCGDGIQQYTESCDDGNTENGDGCSADCIAEEAECGNGVQEFGEQCDDGNDVDEDECSVDCEAPNIDVRETCGNGVQDPGEECDDGGRREGDGCGELCQLEGSVCGNGRLERGEICDDGNIRAGDGCAPDCQFEPGAEPDPAPESDAGLDGGSGSGGGCGCSARESTPAFPRWWMRR